VAKQILILVLIVIVALVSVFCIGKHLNIGGLSNENHKALRVMTFNIRLNTPDDGPNQWPSRKNIAASMIRFHKADITGLQEALKDQVNDLTVLLPEYNWFGVGRDDGKEAGEFMAVFYRKDRLDVLEHSTFWLSETPESPTKGWDAMCYRVVTWGKFKDKNTGKTFYLFNTHFDHMGQVARRESAKLLLQRITEMAGTNPVIVTGDFNSTPETEPYQIIVKGLPADLSTKLVDSETIAKSPHHGPDGTITRFQSANLPDNATIDYIFIKNNVSVDLHGTLSDCFDGRFPSDHMPVLAELVID
jgi:endonuclease/exonuclease/phosphatase family metal-dependent hydrolase